METLEVKVTAVLWPKAGVENPRSWYRLECETAAGRMICCGKVQWRPGEGELLKITGKFEVFKGRQNFNFSDARPNLPVDPRAQLHYVVELTRGMGESAERALWDLLGDGWQKLTDDDAKRLKIRGEALDNFRQQILLLARDQDKSDTISYLLSRGCSSAMSGAAWETWGDKAIGIINSDCFRLAELPHYGFRDIDGDIRKNFGIGDDDPRRIAAAVLYAMRQLTSEGSTVIGWIDLIEYLRGLWVDLDLAQQKISEMFSDFTLRGFPGIQMVALAEYYNAETSIMEFVNHG